MNTDFLLFDTFISLFIYQFFTEIQTISFTYSTQESAKYTVALRRKRPFSTLEIVDTACFSDGNSSGLFPADRQVVWKKHGC